MKELELDSIDKELIELAKTARKNSYSPYSEFKVGAAVYTQDSGMYSGTNVENSAYGCTVCAERIAIFKAVSESDKNIKKVAVVADTDGIASPCGSCRQVIFEFGDDIEVIMSNLKGVVKKVYIKDLLPYGFRL
ncbi:MAG: cytidine deaminase [Candidatus Muirbacterium halophilum]|nr:cytidine deaminase [Candidatus Muirbacterium halophilum]